MGMDRGDLGGPCPGYLATELGRTVQGSGVSGQTSTEIGIRQGGLDIYLTLAGNTIPASGSVGVSVVNPTGQWNDGFTFGFIGSIAGADGTVVPGQLNKSAAPPPVWSFQRAATASAVTVNPDTRWASTEGAANRGKFPIFWAGRNNPDPIVVVRDIKAMVRALPAGRRLLVLSVFNQANEPAGSAGYIATMNVNAALLAEFASNYDLRGWMIRNALALEGITPTTADVTAIAEDRIPLSLMFDNTHTNLAGRHAEAVAVARVIKQKA